MLLTDRIRRDRSRIPELPADFDDECAALMALRHAGARWATRGVAATTNGRLCGYLLGTLQMLEPANPDAAGPPLVTGTIPVAAHAVSGGRAFELYAQMYASLAKTWPACGSHSLDVIASDTDALAAWFALGFGQHAVLAVRGTGRVQGAGFHGSVDIRRAGIADMETVLRFQRDLEQHYRQAPMFERAGVVTEADPQCRIAGVLRDIDNPILIARRNGQALGMICLNRQPLADPLVTAASSISVSQCFTVPEARGLGIALLRHALTWAKSAGYERCTATWLTANLLSARTCLALGFRPLQYRLVRVFNESC